jgi:uridine kinase
MKLTFKIQKALNLSAQKHCHQIRKSSRLPFVTHPVSVMIILSEYTEDENILVASLLHDTLEDVKDYHYENLKNLFDLKIYVDTDSDIRLLRRISRDIKERGRTFDSVKTQYLETVKPMHQKFVEPSKYQADIIIPHGGLNEIANDLIIKKIKEQTNHKYYEARPRNLICRHTILNS